MFKDGYLWKINRPHHSLDYQWALKVTGKPSPKPYELSSYEHARMTGDVYVALALTGEMSDWVNNTEKHRLLEEDAKCFLSGRQVYFEVDRNTEHVGDIAHKAARYMKLDGWFHVIFVAPHGARANNIMNELPENRGTQFVVTLFESISTDPLQNIYVSANRTADFQFLSDILADVPSSERQPPHQ